MSWWATDDRFHLAVGAIIVAVRGVIATAIVIAGRRNRVRRLRRFAAMHGFHLPPAQR